MADFRSIPGESGETDTATEIGRRVSDKATQYGEHALQRTGEAARAARDTVVEHPIATLAIVAGLGFAIGALWKLGSSRHQSTYDELIARLSDLRRQAGRGWR